MNTLRKNQKIILISLVTLGIGATGAVAFAAKSNDAAGKKADPALVVIEDDFWGPLVYEPYDAFANLERHYMRNEMQAASHEVARARSWLLLAAEKAEPITREKLQGSIKTLDKLADDLSHDRPVEASQLRYAIASAKQSLAEWHYFKGREDLAKNDETQAATHLQAAARYLRNAATDIRFDYPNDSLAWFESLDGFGWDEVEVVDFPADTIASNLDKLKNELDRMSGALTKWQHS